MVAATTLPGTPTGRSARNAADGFSTATRPASRISNTPSSPACPKRFFTERSSRYCPTDSRNTVVSTMCSITFGPATVPSFVTCPTRTVAVPVSFAARVMTLVPSRTCATPPGAPSPSTCTVWMESTMHSAGRCSAIRAAT